MALSKPCFRVINSLLLLSSAALSSSCAYVGLSPQYQGPPARPPEIEQYYAKGDSYTSFKEEVLKVKKEYTHKRIEIHSDAGVTVVDYFERPKKSDSLIFVLPVLGGKNVIADYFARYYVRHGFDTAIVNRSNEFKDPTKFFELEEVFRRNIVRDRVAMDFFEREYGKKEFGSFGISRGAINAAMTAGVDPRLKYNVLAMGGTDLVALLRHSKQNGVKKYRNKVIDALGISKDEFYEQLRERIKTDPRYLARYMDARNTLLMLGVFDSTVPFKYGQQLREDIGGPPTVYLAADHFTGLLFTQIASIAMPGEQTILPVDYLEREGLAFYRKAFKKKSSWWMFPFRLLQAPFSLVGSLIMNDRAEDDDEEQEFVPQPPSGGGGRGGLVTAFVGK